jgi:APA family basic amino acid/polyamine antiporter
VFWAYAGFEISTIPAEEIRDPSWTIPKAIVLGVSIVTIFYLVTNAVLFAVMPTDQLAGSSTPLAAATGTALASFPILALIAGIIVGGGALISVAGSDESGMIGTARLGYALAADGLFPRIFAKIHPRFKTPYLGIIVAAVAAFVAANADMSMLIAVSVFLLAVSYLATCMSIFFLRRKGLKALFHLKGGFFIPSVGAIFSLFLITQCTITQIVLGLVLLAVGVPIYVRFTPKKEIAQLKEELFSSESVLKKAYHQEQTFLAHMLYHIKTFYRRVTRKKQIA